MNYDNEIVKLKYDTIFKMFFCNAEHENSVKCFLARVLDISADKIQKIEIKNGEMLPEEIDGKFSRIDIHLQLDNRKINVELQLKMDDSFASRTLFHWAKMYTDDFKAGQDYDELKETICINIINFKMFDCLEYHSFFQIIEKNRHEVLTDKLGIHFFELKKLNSEINQSDPLLLWMRLINSETREELDMLENTNLQEIQEAVMIVRKMSEDEKAKELSRIREKRLHDEVSALGSARREGRAEGRAEGHAEGRAEGRNEGRADRDKELIKKWKEKGFTDEQIRDLLD